ncbi:MAG: hypothetical protein R3C61_03830 [Bacteroidia bacterium]
MKISRYLPVVWFMCGQICPGREKTAARCGSRGCFVSGEVLSEVVVPTTALLHRQGRELVFVWKNDSAFWRYVTPGPQNAEWAIIWDGINLEKS